MHQVVVQALSLVAIVVIGHLMRRAGWVRQEHFSILARIVLTITLPCALFTSFNDFRLPVSLLALGVMGLVVNTVNQASAWFLCRRRGRRAQAFGVLNTATFNMGAFATPYVAGMMGPAGMIHASLFDLGNSISGAGFGRAWARTIARPHERVTVVGFVRTLFSSPVFTTYVVLLVMQVLHLRLPADLITFTSTVGRANTFLAMLMIGVGLDLDLNLRQLRAAASFLGLRYAWSVVFAVITWTLLPLPHEAKVVLTTALAAPIAAMSAGFTDELGLDVKLSSFMASVSILVALVAMPAIILLLG